MKSAIIIPYYNRWDLTHARMMELYKRVKEPCEIILVNDNSPDLDCETGVAWWQGNIHHHTIRYKKNKENLGFGGSMNSGARTAKKYEAELLIFLSNDVIVSGDFVELVQNAVAGCPDVLVGNRLIYWPAGWNEFEDEKGKLVVPYLEGYFLACTTKVWDDLGGFDLRYGKYDYEDVDLSMSAINLGYNLVAINTPILKHLGGQTISTVDPKRIEKTNANRLLFIEKWKDTFSHIHSQLEESNG